MRMGVCYCGKRSFHSEHDAERALGRTQSKRSRRADARGTRRGMQVEGRYYICPDAEGEVYHLTHLSRRQYLGAA